LSSTTENEGLSRFPLPGVPTPLLDADIANKAYVDSRFVNLVKQMFMGITNIVGAGDNRFVIPIGERLNRTSEAEAEVLITSPGTISKLRAKFDLNSLNGALPITIRKNRSDTTLTLSIPATSTSEVTDLINSFTALAGDRISIHQNAGGIGGGAGGELMISFEILFT